ncbi:MAG: hypothetical protein UY15_C0005G0055 [Parcubacteria group bacterium GW2011_GWA2_47_9]|nr:MAG: hypothetical protein UY15_C0005G0055 [Parcubacteria group bacterium GW2011_GWA2_47_9]
MADIPKAPNQNKNPNQNPYDAFQRSNGRLSKEQMHQYMDRMPFRPDQREYAKRLLERFDHPGYDLGITRDEFLKGLDEMAKNPHDPISPQEVERIRQHFSR